MIKHNYVAVCAVGVPYTASADIIDVKLVELNYRSGHPIAKHYRAVKPV